MAVMGVRLAAVLVLATGCISFSSVQKADTLGPGKVQAAVEPGLWGGASPQGVEALPHVDATVRVGVTDRLDLGVRAGSSALELGAKVLLTEPGDPRLAVSLAPGLGGVFLDGRGVTPGSPGIGPAGVVSLDAPLLVGLKLAGGSELVLGPRVLTLLFFSDGPLAAALGVGGSVGFSWQVTEGFALLPEVAALAPVVGRTVAGRILQGLNASGVFVSFKLGLVFGVPRGTEEATAPPPPAPRAVPPL